MFTLVFDQTPPPSLIQVISDLVETIAKREASDDDDHISNWSRAEATAAGDTTAPGVEWHLDAVVASPATIRRVIEATAAFAAELDPMPTRLFVGPVDDPKP
jgi:hypothetical protein